MKCPKCSYLGFDAADRCRNCGYDFSLLAGDTPDPGSPGRPRATPLGVPPVPRGATPSLRPPRAVRDGGRPGTGSGLDRPLARTPDSAPLDLPLFDTGSSRLTALPPPQRPLAVRRPGSATPRPRPRAEGPRPAPLSLDLDPPEPPAVTAARASVTPEPSAPAGAPAPAIRRAAALVVDLALIALVDLVTAYFALRLCGLEPSEWNVLPVAPLAAFFLLLNAGYFILLTGAIGQTLGKMALQIEVVADAASPVGVGRATLRAAAALLTILPAGVGLFWALAGDRRALHDRLAGTRVIHVPVL